MTVRLHATAVFAGGRGALLRGSSGRGKSDLAFRLLQRFTDARLIADDQVCLTAREGRLMARPPDVIAGLLEVRGLGLARVPHMEEGSIDIVVDLVARDEVPRLPEPRHVEIEGVRLPLLALHAFDAGTPGKLRLALATIAVHGFPGEDGLLG
ncbi:MAG: aldolase [Parvibaculaceae bacterium]|nr:aldolase [Parvibaculaceae bacterium]